jgi:predicted DNA binding CopG/RHH family protein
MKTRKRKKNQKYTYDPGEWDESKGIHVKSDRKKTVNELSTSIRLPVSMVNKLRKVASRKGEIGYQTLIKIWIAERLEKELAA